jgi:uncharacterized protein (TIGR02596 family)
MKHHRSQSPSRSLRAFTLVELIVVVGIMALIIAAVAPGLTEVIRAARLTSAGDQVLGRISLAQQQALSLNSPVELRFYSYEEALSGTGTPAIRGMQLIELLNDAATANIGEETAEEVLTQRRLNEPVFLETGMTNLVEDSADQAVQFPRENARYSALIFYPDGGFRLRGTAGANSGTAAETNATVPNLAQSFFTIAESRDLQSSPGEAPPNYYCIQLDPYTGKARTYRP